MTAYEQTKQLTVLNGLLKEWNRAAISLDLEGRGEWARGVVKGIQLAIYALRNEFKEAI